MAKRQELAPMLLNEIRITRPKDTEYDDMPNDSQQKAEQEQDEKKEIVKDSINKPSKGIFDY